MKLICEYCNSEFESLRRKKYCSLECHREADKQNKRFNYVGKREKACRLCGTPLPKFKTRFCSEECKRRYNHLKEGRIKDHGELVKQCAVCGKEFKTWRSLKITCSDECKTYYDNHRPHSKERNRKAYLKKNPNARKLDDIMAEARLKRQKRDEERAKMQADKAQKIADDKVKREAEKQARIDYWQNYHEEQICRNCGKTFISNYPTRVYCSDKCMKHYYKVKRRYKYITVDNNISIEQVALRDKNICQICGCAVDWDDYEIVNGTVICGNNYPSIDHIKPISMGGLHAWDNVQLAHRYCNSIKSNRRIG